MKNLKVRTKLNLILTLVILLVVLASAVSINNMNQVKDKALETIDASSRQSYDDSIKQQVNVVISLLSEVYDEYKAGAYTLDEAKKIAADEVRQMRYGDAGYFWIDQSDGTNVVLLGSDTEGTNRMETQDAEGYQMVKEIIRVAVEDGGGYTDYVFPKEGETEPSPKRSYSEYFEPFDWVVGTGNYTDYIDTAIAAQDEKFSAYAVKKAATMIVACVAMLIIVAILIAMISRDITKSLKKIKDQFDIIAVGNFARKMQKPMLKRKDDFGQLANELEKMRESVRSLLAQVKIEAANIDTVVESIDSHVFNLNGEIEDVSATTEQLAASTQETAASAEQINGMTQQIEEAAREIAIRAQDGATEAEEIHQRATQTKDETVANRMKVKQMLSEIRQGLEKALEDAKVVEQIGVLADSILAITGQTNLLALNASIEAARAGEAGKGFAVVADEVRKLAEQSREQAGEIANLIHGIQNESQNAVDVMQQGIEKVDGGTVAVDSAGATFNEIVTMVSEVAESSKRMAKLVGDLKSGADHITEAIVSIDDKSRGVASEAESVSAATEEQTASMHEIATASRKLSEMAGDLQNAVVKFKI